MQAATSWTREFINGGLSLGLLTWGICAIPAGAWLQRHGGRLLMSVGSLVGGLALMLMGTCIHPAAYLLSWIALGMSMAALLYEPAFAVVTTEFGPHYRNGITLITLVAGLASTVFIPLGAWLVANFTWEKALLALGSVQILLGVPLHALGLPASRHENSPSLKTSIHHRIMSWGRSLYSEAGNRTFAGLAIWVAAHTAAFSGMTFLLIPMFQHEAVDMGALLFAIALIGPMQVTGRLLLVRFGSHSPSRTIGFWAMGAIVAAILLLAAFPHSRWTLATYAILYGAGNGVMTILKGTAVAEYFGRARYAELNGLLSAPAVLSKAAAPVLLAGIWTHSGKTEVVLGTVVIVLFAGIGGLLLVSPVRQ
ncbi:MFS transporter [Roseimicrobium gellanilyticum]|uniref:MFS transporter n=2 Tax=Roseimicrobium gellanilyticum TaxID=748857 RepID=A0A366H8S4_9BACT|nr:MFS transporter [Roseimicrobium gellanilyticum]